VPPLRVQPPRKCTPKRPKATPSQPRRRQPPRASKYTNTRSRHTSSRQPTSTQLPVTSDSHSPRRQSRDRGALSATQASANHMACLLQQMPTASHLPPQALWTAHTELDPTTGASLEYPKLDLTDADLNWLNDAQQAMHAANKAVHPDTGMLSEYKSLRSSSEGTEWETSCANEFGRLAQGVMPHMPTGTDTIHFIPKTAMPHGRSATYLRLVTADRPQKTETKRTRATVGGDKITYPGDVSTKTAGPPKYYSTVSYPPLEPNAW
jgi:hypothetical protein